MTTQKRLLVLVLGTMAGMLMAASAAFACANLTTINLSTQSAAPGSTVDFRADAFRDSTDENPASDIVVHWDAQDGPALASGPSVNRTLEGSFTVPDVESGQYIVVATQYYIDTGDPVPGAPARQSIEVTGAEASGAAVQSTQASEGDAGAAGAPAPAAEEGGAASPSGPAEAPAQASSAPQESAAAPPAAASGPAPAASPQVSATSPSQTTAATPSSPPAASSTPATQDASPAAAVMTSSPAVEQAARFAAAERAAGLHEVAAVPVSQAGEAARFAATERAASTTGAAAPQATTSWSALPSAAAAGWGLLALVLAMGAALMTTRRRRRGMGLAVGRLPMP